MTEQTMDFIASLLNDEVEKSKQTYKFLTSFIAAEAKKCNETTDFDPGWKAYCAGRASTAMDILKKIYGCPIWLTTRGTVGESDLHFESVHVDGKEIFHD